MVALATLRVTEPAPVLQRAPIFASIGEGLRFVFGHQIMLGALALDMFAVLFGGAISLAPAFIHDILQRGPEALGILRGAPALGAVCVGLWLARRPIQRHAGRILLCAVAGFGLCIIGFGLSKLFWLSVLFLLLSGVFDGVSVVLRSTILQLVTPDEMRGRVSSINGIFIGSSNELGAFYSGSMARLLGLVPAVLGGFVTLGVVGFTAHEGAEIAATGFTRLALTLASRFGTTASAYDIRADSIADVFVEALAENIHFHARLQRAADVDAVFVEIGRPTRRRPEDGGDDVAGQRDRIWKRDRAVDFVAIDQRARQIGRSCAAVGRDDEGQVRRGRCSRHWFRPNR